MIVGFGRAPSFFLDKLRSYVAHPRVFIYPEFFDDKNALLRGDRASYVLRLLEHRARIIVALWPDYMVDDRFGLCSYRIIWIYPLHSKSEIDRVPHCIDYIGYVPDTKLRDYTLTWFLNTTRELGYKTWFLGASSREIRLALWCSFDGVDVGTLSVPKLRFRDLQRPDAPKVIAIFLENLAEGRIVTPSQLYRSVADDRAL